MFFIIKLLTDVVPMKVPMDYGQLKSKLQHFLLQQDPQYIDALFANLPAPPVVSIAKSLDRICPIGVRRLQKYLSEGDNAKELSITLDDVQAFAALAKQKVSTFVAYLFSEKIDHQPCKWQRAMTAFFAPVHLGLRRELTHRVFSSEDVQRNEELLELLVKISQLSQEDLQVMRRIINSLSHSPFKNF